MHATCQRCGTEFATARPHTKYCSATCRSAASKARKREADAGGVRDAANVVALAARRTTTRPRRRVAPGGRLESQLRRELGDLIESSTGQQALILCRAMDDPTTPASTLPALSKQLLLLAGSIIAGKQPSIDEDLVSHVQAQVIELRARHADTGAS